MLHFSNLKIVVYRLPEDGRDLLKQVEVNQELCCYIYILDVHTVVLLVIN